ncbi:MAG: trypsin-like peptidase domain-containing protein, partial [Victivallales bacterium]|nr:trypsin-like peptidase domain-containing protein [Victivallales bacterium]
YIKLNDKIYGPIDEEKIRERLINGTFSDSTLFSDDKKHWKRINELSSTLTQPETYIVSPPMYANDDQQREPQSRSSKKENKWKYLFVEKISPLYRQSFLYLKKHIIVFIGITITILLIYYLFNNDNTSTFEDVVKNYESSVGLVVATAEDASGKPLNIMGRDLSTFPIGTAFAIGSNMFATNCHVAYSLKDSSDDIGIRALSIIFPLLVQDFINLAKQKRIHINSDDDLFSFIDTDQDASRMFNEICKELKDNIKISKIEIRLSNKEAIPLQVTSVKIHPKYKPYHLKEDWQQNAEYDIALLYTQKKTKKWFKLASNKILYKLKTAQKIGYIGFPMEGLLASGGLDIDNPIATFKSGTINKITNAQFRNVDNKSNRCITHDIPTTGGASGSPIFLENGQVIAILWGMNVSSISEDGSRISSAAQQNFATRIDVLEDLKFSEEIPIDKWYR